VVIGLIDKRGKNMNKYNILKTKARDKAITIQMEMSEKDLSYYEIINITQKLEKLGKRYGLLNEFKENGVL
jgi:hypothetical protein